MQVCCVSFFCRHHFWTNSAYWLVRLDRLTLLLGLKPKYSHTGAGAFGFAIIFSSRVALHEAHLLHSVCVTNASGPASPHRDKETGWLTGGFTPFVPLWNKRAQVLRPSTEWTLLSSSMLGGERWGKQTRMHNGNISRPAKLLSYFNLSCD